MARVAYRNPDPFRFATISDCWTSPAISTRRSCIRWGSVQIRTFAAEQEPATLGFAKFDVEQRKKKAASSNVSDTGAQRPDSPPTAISPTKKILKRPSEKPRQCPEVFARFVVDYKTSLGESIKLVGSTCLLGNWDTRLAPFMKHQGDGKWAIDIPCSSLLVAGSTATSIMIEYKYVVCNNDTEEAVRWEGGCNRTMLLTPERLHAHDIAETGMLLIPNEWQV